MRWREGGVVACMAGVGGVVRLRREGTWARGGGTGTGGGVRLTLVRVPANQREGHHDSAKGSSRMRSESLASWWTT